MSQFLPDLPARVTRWGTEVVMAGERDRLQAETTIQSAIKARAANAQGSAKRKVMV
jgi:hypothetical protein